MTKIFSRKYWIALTSTTCISAGIALACAGDWGPEYGTSNFTPETFVSNVYSPFFYSMQFYYGINYDDQHISRFNEDNTKEWTAWLGKAATKENTAFLLNSSGAPTIDSALSWADGKSSFRPAGLSAAQTPDRKLADFLKYLQLAKKCELFSLNPVVARWEVDSTNPKKVFDASLLDRQLKEAFLKTKDPFIRERYWFQLIRSFFFNGNPKQTIDLFADQEKNFPHNKIWYRCLAYQAGAWYKLKDYSKANYYYSLVYDGCDELKTVAHYSFHPQEEDDWRKTLALCTSNDEKATCWQMLGIFYSDEKRAIREIYQLNPKSEKLNLLLARSINISEQRFGSWDPNFQQGAFTHQTNSSEDSLAVLVAGIADAGNTDKPWIWQLAAGYLNTLDEHYKEASARYDRAAKSIPSEAMPQAQLRLLVLLNKIGASKSVDARLEKELLPDIEWLYGFDEHASPGFRYTDAFNFLKHTLAARYKAQGELVKSECFFSGADFYQRDKNVEALKALLSKSPRTPYEDLCARLSVIKKDDLFDYQAIMHCLEDKTDDAIALIAQSPAGAAADLPGNPFNGRIQDCHDCDHAAPQKIKYTRLSFLQKLKELKDKVAAGKDVYTNAILLGNASYNITYYGNARAFYECNVIIPAGADPFVNESPYVKKLTDMTIASKYYALALAAAQTGEQKAKCQFMLAKCQRNQWYNTRDSVSKPLGYQFNEDRGPDFVAWEGFKALKQYSGTQYYKEVLKECGYFKTYIDHRKTK